MVWSDCKLEQESVWWSGKGDANVCSFFFLSKHLHFIGRLCHSVCCFVFLQENFVPLYDLQYSFLLVTFNGRTEDELSAHLEGVRESAKRMGMHWAHRRACFLLGRLCAKKLKLSQVCALKLSYVLWCWQPLFLTQDLKFPKHTFLGSLFFIPDPSVAVSYDQLSKKR